MSSAAKYILAIDLGTSGPKVALVSMFGDVLDHEFEKTDTIFLARGGVEEDPEDWWNAIVKAAKRLLSKNLVPTSDILAICCTSQWSGTVAVDKKGNHLMNAMTWMDARGADQKQAARTVPVLSSATMKVLVTLVALGILATASAVQSRPTLIWVEAPGVRMETARLLSADGALLWLGEAIERGELRPLAA